MSTPENLTERMAVVLGNPTVTRHSYFQLKHFVVGREPTHQRKLWRCLEELRVRKEGIDSISLQIEDAKDQLELLAIEKERHILRGKNANPCNNFGAVVYSTEEVVLVRKESEIKARQTERKITALVESIEKLKQNKINQEEEATFFLEAFMSLERKEKLKPFDDFESQLDYWNEKYSQMLNMRVLLGLPLDPELIHSTLALPESPVKKQTMAMLENQAKQIKKMQHTVAIDGTPSDQ